MAVLRFDWNTLYADLKVCTKCRLCETRTNIVISDGDPHADIMFIGEGPGREEDEQGVPFVGAAGRLFNYLLEEAGLDRKSIYICNVLKCRPPQNRDPFPDEADACLPYLRAQIALVRPKVIVCLGRISAKALIDPDFRITREHGVWYDIDGRRVMATYHPSALLRDVSKRPEAFMDLRSLRKEIRAVCDSVYL